MKPLTDKKIYSYLLQYARPYWKKIIILIFLVLTLSLVQIILPIITKNVIDNYIDRSYLQLKSVPYSKDISASYQANHVSTDTHIYISSNVLTKDDYINLDQRGLILPGKYYLFSTENEINQIKEYNLQGITTENGIILSSSYLEELSRNEIKELRADDLQQVKFYAIIYISLLLILFFFNYFQVIMMAMISERMMYDLRSALMEHIMSLSMNFFTHNPLGRLVTRITNDVDALREMFSEVLIYSLKDFLTIIGIFVIMFSLSVPLSLVLIGLIPVLIIILFLFQKYAREAYRMVRITLARINSFLAEAIAGISLIQIFNQEKKSFDDFKITGEAYYQANLRQLLVFAIFRPLIDLLSLITIGLLIYYGGRGVLQGKYSIGLIIAFIAYLQMLFRPIFDFAEKFNIFQSAMASSERIFHLFTVDDKIKTIGRTKTPKNREGKIEFRNVSFEYVKGEKVLDSISFTIQPNQSVAFVGTTGAGKSTLINLLLRFYEPTKGKILIDEVDIHSMNLKELRSYFGLVLQDVFIFSGDIEYNILLNRNISRDKMIEYAKYVNAHPFIDRLKDKYHHRISEGGSNLSVGQKQLLAFSRALIKEPNILVLDEATSSIDSETEYLIQDAIRKIMKERTCIAIAHRLSTIQNADKIYVLQKGRIVEIGNHTELLALEGYYYQLYQFQDLTI